MYSQKSWGGPVDPHILVKFNNDTTEDGDPMASMIIFEWKDYDLIGVLPTDSTQVHVSERRTNAKVLMNITERVYLRPELNR